MLDEKFLVQIHKILEDNPTRSVNVFCAKKNKELAEVIIKATPLIDSSHSFMQRVEWIVNNRNDFPVCETCGKKLSDPKSFLNFKAGYRHFCCNSCSTSNQKTIEAHSNTCLKKYGVSWFKDNEKDRSTKLRRYGDPTFNNRDKARKTYRSQTGYESSMANPDVVKKVLERRSKTCMSRYGNTSFFGTRAFEERCLERYGVEYPAQNSEIQRKTKTRYLFDSRNFDTKPEIAYYIWLKDHNKNFQYHDGTSFSYEFDGELRKYFPDFKVGDQYVEIKGPQFFESGDYSKKMICPYRNSEWSEERYLKECQKYEAKHQCMLKNDVRIVSSPEYQHYLDYVAQKYGKNYLNQFKLR